MRKALEFVELQFRYLLSSLSNHKILRNIHRKSWIHGRRPSCKCRHWKCVLNSILISCYKSSCTKMHWNRSCSTWCRRLMKPLIKILGGIKCRTLSRRIPCVKWQDTMCSSHSWEKKSWNGYKNASRNSLCWAIKQGGSIHLLRKILWSECQRVVFWCQHVFWILGSKLILSNNRSRATLWVLDTRLIVRLRPFIIILITA